MSYWTHINGAIRFDCLSLGAVDTPSPLTFGNTCSFEDSNEIWDVCDVPCGSEGSLQYKYIPYEEKCEDSITSGTLVIWGDLRGYEKEEQPEIIEWLSMCATKYRKQGMWVRDGVVQINEDTYTYQEDDDDYKKFEWKKL